VGHDDDDAIVGEGKAMASMEQGIDGSSHRLNVHRLNVASAERRIEGAMHRSDRCADS
jgi:hypothetical protein